MAVGVSSKSDVNIVPHPCTWNESGRNQAQDIKGIPIGGVFFWVKTVEELPNGCVIMDGDANSTENGGSGIDAIGSYVKGATLAGGPFPRTDTGPAGAHSHDMDVLDTTVGVQVAVLKNNTGISVVEVPDHMHDINEDCLFVSYEPLEAKGVTSKVKLEIEDHACIDITKCIRDHPDHAHRFPMAASFVRGGQGVANTSLCTSGVLSEGCGEALDGTLNHLPNSQNSVGHTFTFSDVDCAAGSANKEHRHCFEVKFEPHNHIILDDDGTENCHDHGGETAGAGRHDHDIVDPKHGHGADTTVFPHDHVAEVDAVGDHVHKSGEPQHIHLVPVERIF